jgi:hypothetical protein
MTGCPHSWIHQLYFSLADSWGVFGFMGLSLFHSDASPCFSWSVFGMQPSSYTFLQVLLAERERIISLSFSLL